MLRYSRAGWAREVFAADGGNSGSPDSAAAQICEQQGVDWSKLVLGKVRAGACVVVGIRVSTGSTEVNFELRHSAP